MIPTKYDRCTRCDTQYEWTTRKSGFCKPCRKQNKRAYRISYYAPRESTKDPLPPVDGLMEIQFRTFFSLIRTRYRGIKDVSQVVKKVDHNKPYTKKKQA